MRNATQGQELTPWRVVYLDDFRQSSRLRPSREQAVVADSRMLRELADPEWEQDIIEACALLKDLNVRKAGTPFHRASMGLLDSDVVMIAAMLLATGAVAVCAVGLTGLPLVPVVVAPTGVMALALSCIQRLHRTA